MIVHCATVIFVKLTSDPCSVCTTLNCLLGEVLFVSWDIVLNALLTLVHVTVFIVWLSKVSVRFFKCVTTSFLEFLRADLIIFLAGCCSKGSQFVQSTSKDHL